MFPGELASIAKKLSGRPRRRDYGPAQPIILPRQSFAQKTLYAALHFGRSWHKASLRGSAANGRFWGNSDRCWSVDDPMAQYSSASMMVITRSVTVGSDGSGGMQRQSRIIIIDPETDRVPIDLK